MSGPLAQLLQDFGIRELIKIVLRIAHYAV